MSIYSSLPTVLYIHIYQYYANSFYQLLLFRSINKQHQQLSNNIQCWKYIKYEYKLLSYLTIEQQQLYYHAIFPYLHSIILYQSIINQYNQEQLIQLLEAFKIANNINILEYHYDQNNKDNQHSDNFYYYTNHYILESDNSIINNYTFFNELIQSYLTINCNTIKLIINNNCNHNIDPPQLLNIKQLVKYKQFKQLSIPIIINIDEEEEEEKGNEQQQQQIINNNHNNNDKDNNDKDNNNTDKELLLPPSLQLPYNRLFSSLTILNLNYKHIEQYNKIIHTNNNMFNLLSLFTISSPLLSSLTISTKYLNEQLFQLIGKFNLLQQLSLNGKNHQYFNNNYMKLLSNCKELIELSISFSSIMIVTSEMMLNYHFLHSLLSLQLFKFPYLLLIEEDFTILSSTYLNHFDITKYYNVHYQLPSSSSSSSALSPSLSSSLLSLSNENSFSSSIPFLTSIHSIDHYDYSYHDQLIQYCTIFPYYHSFYIFEIGNIKQFNTNLEQYEQLLQLWFFCNDYNSYTLDIMNNMQKLQILYIEGKQSFYLFMNATEEFKLSLQSLYITITKLSYSNNNNHNLTIYPYNTIPTIIDYSIFSSYTNLQLFDLRIDYKELTINLFSSLFTIRTLTSLSIDIQDGNNYKNELIQMNINYTNISKLSKLQCLRFNSIPIHTIEQLQCFTSQFLPNLLKLSLTSPYEFINRTEYIKLKLNYILDYKQI